MTNRESTTRRVNWRTIVINIPGEGGYDGPWAITHPLLKLALKYGVFGPWAGPTNWSVEFDRYALSRSPAAGPPRLTDLVATVLMNSGVRKEGLRGLSTWLGTETVQSAATHLALTLAQSTGLADASLDELGAFGESAMTVHGIGPATAFKWLAAWAPAHVPMLDSLVLKALVGGEPRAARTPRKALPRFQELLRQHLADLTDLGRQLAALLSPALQPPLPPVRVLDSLIWFDWWMSSRYYQGEFKVWLRSPRKKPVMDYEITEEGLRSERALMDRLSPAG
jgi:hypothetical protein